MRMKLENEEMERKKMEAELENQNMMTEELVDFSDWKPKTEIDEIAVRIPPYIE